jgi:hypothetical protein
MITGEKAKLGHILPFGSLLFTVEDKHQIADPKFDPRAQATVYVGHEHAEGHKCLKGDSFDYSNKEQRGHIMFSSHGWSDPSFSPFRKRGEEKVVSLSGASYMSGKEKLDQEIPSPPEIEQWVNFSI